MLGNDYFHFDTLRKSAAVFGKIFSSIHIERFDEDEQLLKSMKVPLGYAPKEKVLSRLIAEPNPPEDQRPAVTLPRMSFEIVGAKYDGLRKLSTTVKIAHKVDGSPNRLWKAYVPVPYDLSFNLYVYTKHALDSNKIIEQILPFFTPDWTSRVLLVPEAEIYHDIPVVIAGDPQLDDTYDGKFENRRAIVWTIPFVMKTYFYGPVKDKPIIKFSNTHFYVGNTSDPGDKVSRIRVTPGLDANGDPTTIANNSVDPNTIYVDDDFGFVTVVTTGDVLIGEQG